MWSAAAILLLLPLALSGIALSRGELMERVVALQVATVILILELLVLATILERAFFFDVALTLAVVGFMGSLAFVRILGHWL